MENQFDDMPEQKTDAVGGNTEDTAGSKEVNNVAPESARESTEAVTETVQNCEVPSETNQAAEDGVSSQNEEIAEPTAEKEMEQPVQENQAGEKMIYTDPNEGVVPAKPVNCEGQYQYGANGSQNQSQGQYQQQYQSNFDYNTASGTTGYRADYYEEKEDTSPMSLGDWLLTILALIIPCAGIVLYFVWAFGKNVNVNRRNYCRAALIVEGIKIVLGIILGILFAAVIAAGGNYYY